MSSEADSGANSIIKGLG